MTIFPSALEVILDDAASRDRTTARRKTLLEILLHERYLTREQLIVRVEGVLGAGCFGASSWKDAFYRDMQVVKRALRAAGQQLVYSRRKGRSGYFLKNQPAISAELSAVLESSVAEVNSAQIAILKSLSFRQRFQQGCSVTNLACQVVAHQIQQRTPHLSLTEAWRTAIHKAQR